MLSVSAPIDRESCDYEICRSGGYEVPLGPRPLVNLPAFENLQPFPVSKCPALALVIFQIEGAAGGSRTCETLLDSTRPVADLAGLFQPLRFPKQITLTLRGHRVYL